MYDKSKKLRKLRSWDSAAQWNLTNVGKGYYGHIGGSEWVLSIPCHYVIAKANDKKVMYRGYFPVSQLRSSLKEKINDVVKGESTKVEEVKSLVLKQLQVGTDHTENYLDF